MGGNSLLLKQTIQVFLRAGIAQGFSLHNQLRMGYRRQDRLTSGTIVAALTLVKLLNDPKVTCPFARAGSGFTAGASAGG